ncbi:MAG TPA: 2OG-Fe dioxygenase family protein [Magnetospirillaceae bacterium]|jgi:hypothetical protein
MLTLTESLQSIGSALTRDGFAFVNAPTMQMDLLAAGLRDWDAFAESWNDLGLDTYMADGGRYRRRRHGAFALSPQGIERKAHQPHYQSRDYNQLNGGLERWFKPITDEIGTHPAMRAILTTCFNLFDGLTPLATRPAAWHTEVHQFRIEARADQLGKPTPEGLHRDGVDWVLVLLVARQNIASGMTTVHDIDKRQVGSFTLTRPMDAAWVDDSRVYHGVTAIEPLDPTQPGYRDVLVVTLRR